MKPSNIIAAANAFQAATRGDVVPVEVISQRARICKGCPARAKAQGVGRVSKILGDIANKHRVDKDISGFQCSICGCSMMLLLPSTKPHQDSPKERERRKKINPNCWMLKL